MAPNSCDQQSPEDSVSLNLKQGGDKSACDKVFSKEVQFEWGFWDE